MGSLPAWGIDTMAASCKMNSMEGIMKVVATMKRSKGVWVIETTLPRRIISVFRNPGFAVENHVVRTLH